MHQSQREDFYKRVYKEKRHSNSFNYAHRDYPKRQLNDAPCAQAGGGFASSEAAAVGFSKNFHVILDIISRNARNVSRNARNGKRNVRNVRTCGVRIENQCAF